MSEGLKTVEPEFLEHRPSQIWPFPFYSMILCTALAQSLRDHLMGAKKKLLTAWKELHRLHAYRSPSNVDLSETPSEACNHDSSEPWTSGKRWRAPQPGPLNGSRYYYDKGEDDALATTSFDGDPKTATAKAAARVDLAATSPRRE